MIDMSVINRANAIGFKSNALNEKGFAPQQKPLPDVNQASDDFNKMMEALANAAKGLIEAKKATGSENKKEITTEDVIQKMEEMDANAVEVKDMLELRKMGLHIKDDGKLIAVNDKELSDILGDNETFTIKNTDEKHGITKMTEYDKTGRPITCITKLDSSFGPDTYSAFFYEYKNNYSMAHSVTHYKNTRFVQQRETNPFYLQPYHDLY